MLHFRQTKPTERCEETPRQLLVLLLDTSKIFQRPKKLAIEMISLGGGEL